MAIVSADARPSLVHIDHDSTVKLNCKGREMRLDGYRFYYELRVRWSEVDGQQIVFNANYLAYMDLAYAEYLRRELKLSSGLPSTVIAKSTLQFRQSAEFDDVLRVWVRTSLIGRTSMTVDFAITRDDEVLFDAQTIYVYVDKETKRPTPVPDEWRRTIEEYEQGR
ncbi:acyl-CoA thioesterase [Alicyclobacillus dauci]|uniref:Acyl-CoA thioesterase n=1 Tax=Alicyclobacillus dauci TaxID=1475485 RepID=A0ABY6Z4V9_9BACL|nr:thioesterase family protein [Alicyclobacillus dauci]WAH37847.1 acyl-CoA thioesterase [Alicyclobacillus dauci]